MNGTKRFKSICAVCGDPVLGAADPYEGATVPQPGEGEVPLCLSCLLFPGAAGCEQAREAFEGWGDRLLIKSELAEA